MLSAHITVEDLCCGTWLRLGHRRRRSQFVIATALLVPVNLAQEFGQARYRVLQAIVSLLSAPYRPVKVLSFLDYIVLDQVLASLDLLFESCRFLISGASLHCLAINCVSAREIVIRGHAFEHLNPLDRFAALG